MSTVLPSAIRKPNSTFHNTTNSDIRFPHISSSSQSSSHPLSHPSLQRVVSHTVRPTTQRRCKYYFDQLLVNPMKYIHRGLMDKIERTALPPHLNGLEMSVISALGNRYFNIDPVHAGRDYCGSISSILVKAHLWLDSLDHRATELFLSSSAHKTIRHNYKLAQTGESNKKHIRAIPLTKELDVGYILGFAPLLNPYNFGNDGIIDNLSSQTVDEWLIQPCTSDLKGYQKLQRWTYYLDHKEAAALLPHQKEFASLCLSQMYPLIFDKEWKSSQEEVVKGYKLEIDNMTQQAALITPRRFGKTVALISVCVATLFTIPDITISIFATTMLAARRLLSGIKIQTAKFPEFDKFCNINNANTLTYLFGPNDIRTVEAFSSNPEFGKLWATIWTMDAYNGLNCASVCINICDETYIQK